MKLQIKEKDGKLFTSSKEIANAYGKRHKNVVRDIKDEFEGEISLGSNLSSVNQASYKDGSGKSNIMYILDEYAAMRLCARYSKEIRKNVVEAFKEAKEKLTAIEIKPTAIPLALDDGFQCSQCNARPNKLYGKNFGCSCSRKRKKSTAS